MDAELWTVNAGGQQVEVAALDTFREPDLFRQAGIPVADQRWTLRTRGSSAALLGPARVLPAGMAAALAVETLTEGVGVVNERGEFLVHNPAAKRILGVDKDVDGADAWQEHYGVF